jgi:beta-glucosidase
MNFPVRGYYHWSLVDNFEWTDGWQNRFGLWELNPATQERTPRRSAELYAKICRENGLTTEMIEEYCPEVLEKVFPF